MADADSFTQADQARGMIEANKAYGERLALRERWGLPSLLNSQATSRGIDDAMQHMSQLETENRRLRKHSIAYKDALTRIANESEDTASSQKTASDLREIAREALRETGGLEEQE